MDQKKIAFILCVNDEMEYMECQRYLDRLIVPKGYVTDTLVVREAPSMAAGYNAGRQSTDAAYKIYLHQDVFIINRYFIQDMLAVFAKDRQIGLMGCIGVSHLDEYARAVTDWDTGKILHNCTPALMELSGTQEGCMDVEAVDGLLIATHGDVAWREDLFDGWDFYDISQCMEYKRAGYRCVVAGQKTPWCYHDNSYSKMRNYYDYNLVFAREYADIRPFKAVTPSEEALNLAESKERAREELYALTDMGGHAQIKAIFQKEENRGWLHLREYQLLADIDECEENAGVVKRLWRQELSAEELLRNLRRIKYLLKRLEYGAYDQENVFEELCGEYSVYAIVLVYGEYVVYKELVFEKILEYYMKNHMDAQGDLWMKKGGSFIHK
ncbi:MAG: glycosyltransferase family protein [Clostridiales bacterium]|nr:glycosyltransferase family protein [Roseburia sp.]MDD7637185.1 glycosyltransferase family protein [Clostridiales bacterium]